MAPGGELPLLLTIRLGRWEVHMKRREFLGVAAAAAVAPMAWPTGSCISSFRRHARST
jgi:hypothetical protein